MTIDCKEKSPKNLASECIFCYPEPELLFMSTEHFNVIFDKYPLIEGHLVIHSKEHWGCAGEVPDEIFYELNQIKGYIKELLDLKYGTVSFYEHGRAGHCISYGIEKRLCHHFHLHALPLAHDISSILQERFIELKMDKFDEIKEMFDRFGEYLFFESSHEKKHFFIANGEIESHLLRTLIAQALNRPERSNWEKCTSNSIFINSAKNKLGAIKTKKQQDLFRI